MARSQRGWYKAEVKQQYVLEYLNSNLSISSFADSKGLKRSTFNTWLNIYNKAMLAVEKPATFQDITSILKQDVQLEGESNNTQKNNDVKIKLQNGITLEFDVAILKQVLSVLK